MLFLKRAARTGPDQRGLLRFSETCHGRLSLGRPFSIETEFFCEYVQHLHFDGFITRVRRLSTSVFRPTMPLPRQSLRYLTLSGHLVTFESMLVYHPIQYRYVIKKDGLFCRRRIIVNWNSFGGTLGTCLNAIFKQRRPFLKLSLSTTAMNTPPKFF